jgi:hypothetical protein
MTLVTDIALGAADAFLQGNLRALSQRKSSSQILDSRRR